MKTLTVCGLMAAAVAGASLIGASDSNVQAIEYTFTKIADTGWDSPFVMLDSPTPLSNAGHVVYSGLYKVGGGAIAVSNGVLSGEVFSVSPIQSGIIGFSGNVGVNDRGAVAYLRFGPGLTEQAIVSGADVARTGPVFTALGPPTINHDGAVAFSAVLAAGGSGIFVSGGAALYDSSGPFGNLFVPGYAVINDSGRVAFYGNLDTGGGGIYIGTGGPPTPVALSTDPIIRPLLAAFSMNNAGVVAFQGQRGTGIITGIYTGSGGAVTPVVETGSVFSGVDTPSINNTGTVAFRGHSLSQFGGLGIFTGADPVADKVVAAGDALDGSTVADLQFYRQGLNDFGQVAFFARLADGRSAVFRADPPGMSQRTPTLPSVVGPGRFRYTAARSGQWFDPPLAYGYDYVMTTPGALFTDIVQLPDGFAGPFTVSSEGVDLGQFSGGAGVDFVSLLGHGVLEFRVAGINPMVDPNDPLGFPLQIAFNTPTADFEQTAVVPEPGGLALLIAGAVPALVWRLLSRGIRPVPGCGRAAGACGPPWPRSGGSARG